MAPGDEIVRWIPVFFPNRQVSVSNLSKVAMQ